MKDNTWQLQEAKSKFSRVVDAAMQKSPQIVTRHGLKAVVIMSYDEYAKMNHPKQGLVDFLRSSPLGGIEIDTTRSKESPRNIEL